MAENTLLSDGALNDIRAWHIYSNWGNVNPSNNGIFGLPVANNAGAVNVPGAIPSRPGGGPFEGQVVWLKNTNQLIVYNGAAWTVVGPSTGYWEAVGGDIRPVAPGFDVIPRAHNTYDLGLNGTRWRHGYFSGDIYCDDIFCDDIQCDVISADQVQVTDGVGGAVRGVLDNNGAGCQLDAISDDLYLTAAVDVYCGDFGGDDTFVYAYDWIYIETDTDGIRIDAADNIDIDATTTIDIDANNDINIESQDEVTIIAHDPWIVLDPADDVMPGDDCRDDLGDLTDNLVWDNVDCDNVNQNQCDVAEMQFTIKDEIDDLVLPAGTVIEMCEAPQFLKDIRAEALELTNHYAEINPAKHRVKPFHKHHGLTCAWRRASRRSTKCPSVISTSPGTTMGMTPTVYKYAQQGHFQPVALSGSVQHVKVEGNFEVGDILVSAGNGNAMVDNNAPPQQWLGWAKESGKDRRIEVWLK